MKGYTAIHNIFKVARRCSRRFIGGKRSASPYINLHGKFMRGVFFSFGFNNVAERQRIQRWSAQSVESVLFRTCALIYFHEHRYSFWKEISGRCEFTKNIVGASHHLFGSIHKMFVIDEGGEELTTTNRRQEILCLFEQRKILSQPE